LFSFIFLPVLTHKYSQRGLDAGTKEGGRFAAQYTPRTVLPVAVEVGIAGVLKL
jgi:hypothetical protein